MPESIDLSSQNALATLLPHPPQLSSQDSGWSNGALIHYHQHPGCESPTAVFQQHALEVIEAGKGSDHERRLGQRYLSHPLGGEEVTFCPAHVTHWTVWDQPLSFTVIALDSACITELMQQIFGRDDLELEPRWQVYDPLIHKIVAALRSDLAMGCPAGRLYGESFLTSLAVHLLSHVASPQETPQLPSPAELSPRIRQQVIEFIEDHLTTDLALTDLAAQTGFSPFHFCRLFKQSMQITPHQYMIRRRVERAKYLLQHSQLSIAEIAVACGFAHQSHLSRHFRRWVGTSPKAFRQVQQL